MSTILLGVHDGPVATLLPPRATHPAPDDDAAALTAAWLPLPATPEPAIGTRAVGVVVPYDFALDRELWRWVPDDVALHLTRTPYQPLPVGLEQAEAVGAPAVVARAARDLRVVAPDVIAYGCTSGSFVAGPDGERAITAAVHAEGIGTALTTSGALVTALHHLGATRVAVGTPYDGATSGRLADFLTSSGVRVVGRAHLGLTGRIWAVPYDLTRTLVRAAVRDAADTVGGCEAVVLSCTNLPTYDVIADLEEELDVAVVSANQATVWAALRALHLDAVGPGQRLLGPGTTAGASARVGA